MGTAFDTAVAVLDMEAGEQPTARESCGQVRRQRRGRVADIAELKRLRRREALVDADLATAQRTRAVVEHGQAVGGGTGRG